MKEPYYRDLIAILTLTILSVIWLIVPALNISPFNIIPYILLLLFLPGYSLLALFKPTIYENRISSLIYSIILSFVITISAALVSSLISLNIPIITLIPPLTVILILIAIVRRRIFFKKYFSSRLEEISSQLREETAPSKSGVKESPRSKPEAKPSKKRFYSLDLLLVLIFTVLCALFILEPTLSKSIVRTVLGFLLILILPGYALIATLFPKKGDLDVIERLALSFGLSIAITTLIGLALNYTPFGIRLEPILISLSGITLLLILTAYLRRQRTPEENRFWVDFGGFFSSIGQGFSRESRTSKILSIILIIVLILAVSLTAYLIVQPKPSEKFTEFYILGPNGKASDYPTNLTSGQNGTVIIGVINHENAPTTYRVVTASNGTAMDIMTFELQDGEKKEFPYTFTVGYPGLKKIDFFLFKLPDNSNVYRSLHLWVNITGSPPVSP